VLDLSELADLLDSKIDAVLDPKTTQEGYREALVRDLSESYVYTCCRKYDEVY
jgi:hypothetical protein